jgi:hypothetical protein
MLRPLYTVSALATASVLMFSVCQSFSEILVEGVVTPLSGTTSFLRPELAGTIIADRVRPFSLTLPTGGTITGSIQDRVVRQDVAGTLDFYWRVVSDQNSAGTLSYFRIGEFVPDPYVFDSNYRTDGAGDVPVDSGYLFGAPWAGQGYVNFGLTLRPGQGSPFMFVSTKATEYSDTAAMDVATIGTTEASNSLSTFAPAVVPEPGSLSLVGMGGLVLMAVRRRAAKRC